jgi:hypothetical protein
VVDDLAATHRRRERIEVENVSANGLRAQPGEHVRRGVRAGQSLDLAAGAQQPLDERAAEKPRAARDENRVGRQVPYLISLENAEEKRARYSAADATVIAAATIIAHSSTRRGPSGPPRWRIARKIAMNWAFVFSFPQIDGGKTVP